MRALIMDEPCDGPERTSVREVAAPSPGPGAVAIDVAFAVTDVIADPDMDDATRADMQEWTGTALT